MSNSRVSLSGSKITHMISRVGLVFGLFPLLALVEGIRLGEDPAPFFRDVGPFILSLLLVCYVSYSYRMVVERESGSGMVIFSRQILHSSIRFRKREFGIDQLDVRQITMGGGEDSQPTDYTTVVVDGKDFFTYIGHRRKILKAIPELSKKLQSPNVSLTMRKKRAKKMNTGNPTLKTSGSDRTGLKAAPESQKTGTSHMMGHPQKWRQSTKITTELIEEMEPFLWTSTSTNGVSLRDSGLPNKRKSGGINKHLLGIKGRY